MVELLSLLITQSIAVRRAHALPGFHAERVDAELFFIDSAQLN